MFRFNGILQMSVTSVVNIVIFFRETDAGN